MGYTEEYWDIARATANPHTHTLTKNKQFDTFSLALIIFLHFILIQITNWNTLIFGLNQLARNCLSMTMIGD